MSLTGHAAWSRRETRREFGVSRFTRSFGVVNRLDRLCNFRYQPKPCGIRANGLRFAYYSEPIRCYLTISAIDSARSLNGWPPL